MSARRRAVTATAAVMLAALSGCGSGDNQIGGSSKEAVTGANETFRLGVGPGGHVSAPATMRVPAGTDVKLVLRNSSSQAYRLRVTGPKQGEELTFRTPAGQRNQGNVVLLKGRYRVTVALAGQQSGSSPAPGGRPEATTFVIAVGG